MDHGADAALVRNTGAAAAGDDVSCPRRCSADEGVGGARGDYDGTPAKSQATCNVCADEVTLNNVVRGPGVSYLYVDVISRDNIAGCGTRSSDDVICGSINQYSHVI